MTPTSAPLKKPTSGLFVLCLILSLAAIFFLIVPKYKTYSIARDENKLAKQELETIAQEEAELQKRYIEIKNGQAELTRADLAIPDKSDISSIYALMETFSRSANLTISSIQAADDADIPESEKTPDQVSISPTLGTITVNMQVNGSVPGFVQLLSTVEQSLRFIDVQSIDITKENDQEALTFRVSFKTYYQR